jgi:hypothetical protein
VIRRQDVERQRRLIERRRAELEAEIASKRRAFEEETSEASRILEQARLREEVLTSDRDGMARQRGTPESSPDLQRRVRRLKVAKKGGSS